MTKHQIRKPALLLVVPLLSACALALPAREPQRGFFERDVPGDARCYAGAAIARAWDERVERDTTRDRTVYLVIDTLRGPDGRQPAHIIEPTQSTGRTDATWVATGDSLYVEEWGVMPKTSYLLHEDGATLSGRAWMEHDTVLCFNGACRGPRVSHWDIRARRIPCSDVSRGKGVSLPDALQG